MTEVDRTLHVLFAADNDRIFREQIVPDVLVGTPQEQPLAIIVSGQTGAGKTSITTLATQALAGRGAAVNINLDTYKPYHPKFDELMRSHVRRGLGRRSRRRARATWLSGEAKAQVRRLDACFDCVSLPAGSAFET
ncbi:zeta toxin family protein [Streptomyces sp. NPDC007808]|uniref:zeta toxin family protein n=1 Tax=Streptomyces sp. NPDC007808 TaxID=3364779 RepID=UPI0036C4B95A